MKLKAENSQQAETQVLSIPVVSNTLDLRELERKLGEALEKETRATLTEWIKR